MPEKIYTTYQIGKFCQVNIRTVIRWIETGKLKAYSTPGGHRRVKWSDLITFLTQNRMPIPKELEEAIATKLREGKVVLNPSVNVQILTYRPFFILGEVTQPGQFPFIENMTVLTAVAMAGGFTYRANVNGFTITRKIGNKIIEARAGRSSLVQPGDVIYVDERLF